MERLPSLLGILDAGVDWAVPGKAPWSGEGRGHEHVGRFFEKFGITASLKAFEPRSFLADGDTVVVMGDWLVGFRPNHFINILRDWPTSQPTYADMHSAMTKSRKLNAGYVFVTEQQQPSNPSDHLPFMDDGTGSPAPVAGP
jgi:hypothetical protein